MRSGSLWAAAFLVVMNIQKTANSMRQGRENCPIGFRYSDEQKIRFAVLDRRVTQGTNSNAGMRFYERIWTVVASCTAQQKNIFKFLTQSLKAHYANTLPPSILP